MNSILELSVPWWHFVVRGVVVYLGLLVMLRLCGKHSFGEMSAFDVIVLVLVGGTLRTSIVGPDTSFLGALISVAGILTADKVLAWLCSRNAAINRLVEGRPAFLIRAGARVPGALRRCSIPEAAFERALHAQGLENETTVLTARLEPNGKITLTRRT